MAKQGSVGIAYPYIHPKGTIGYVSINNIYMQAAKEVARKHSLDKTMPTGSVIVKGENIIGKGANGSNYHETSGCERVRLNIPTGQNYELCEGCSPKNHSEPKAIQDARHASKDTNNAKLYLWGHWWCCEPCWDALIRAGINDVLLLENSYMLFNKLASNNIVGAQFDRQAKKELTRNAEFIKSRPRL